MQKRRSLVVPKTLVKGDRILRLCIRCRHKKIRCDAAATSPNPCTYCLKKSMVCVLDVTHASKRSHDLTERLMCDVHDLHRRLDLVVSRRARLVQQLMDRTRQGFKSVAAPGSLPQQAVTPASPLDVLHMQKVLDSPRDSPPPVYIDPIPTLSLANSFSIHLDPSVVPWTLLHARARLLFDTFESKYAVHLPVFLPSFFSRSLHDIHSESDLLFWAIVVTALLLDGSPQEYILLAHHVQNLVVVNCWLNTPRSLYLLVALLVLTTWPLPDDHADYVQDSISVKYISLMKSLSLQLGLHRPGFLDEFSSKTHMDIDPEAAVSRAVHERIYKLVTVNANYWLVYLGLSNSNYNGSHQDYVVNRAANVDIFNQDAFGASDNYVNSLLKVSLVQLRMNESMIDLVENPSSVSRLIHLSMFESILNDYETLRSPLVDSDLMVLSLEYSKLQLYVYHFSHVDISLSEYKLVVARTVVCCQRVLDLFDKQFGHHANFYLVPVHFRFSIKLAALVLLVIHSSPLLESLEAYKEVKALFMRAYGIITHCDSPEWLQLSKKFFRLVHKFNDCDREKLLIVRADTHSFFLINKMTNYLVSGLQHELIWHIYQTENMDTANVDDIDWSLYGLSREVPAQASIIDYITGPCSIFS